MALVTEKNKKILWGITERVLKTFFQAFFAQLTVTQLVQAATTQKVSIILQAATAGLAAVYSLIQNLLGTYLGNTSSPAWLPGPLDPATPPVPDIDPLPDAAPAPYVHKGG